MIARFVVAVAGLLGAAAMGACGAPASRGGTALLVGRAADAIGLDPARISDAESVEVAEQIFEPLVRIEPRTQQIEPALALRWESTDGREWTFHLRPGVRFHDGQPFDADAVVFSFERQRNPRHPFHVADFAYEQLFRDIVRIEAAGPLTVRISLREAFAPFLANLSMFAMAIVSPTAVADLGAKFMEHPVGTGPFRFVDWTRGERITLAPNLEYWGTVPAVKPLAFVLVPDPRQRLVKLEGGAIDVAEDLAPQDLQFLVLHPELRAERIAGHNVAYLAMNTRHAPFDDERVRRAVNLAIDKTAIVRLVYQGLAEVATGPLAPSMWGYRSRAAEPANPARARQLLAQAGWDRRRRVTLYVPSTPRPYLPEPERVARMIAQNLHDVGIEVLLVGSEMNRHLQSTSGGLHDLCLTGWTVDNGDPENVLSTLFHSENRRPGVTQNVSFYGNSHVDELLESAERTLDRARRAALYAEVQDILAVEVPIVPIAHSELVVARRRNLRGLFLPPTASIVFRDASFER